MNPSPRLTDAEIACLVDDVNEAISNCFVFFRRTAIRERNEAIAEAEAATKARDLK